MKGSSKDVEKALNDPAPENIKAFDKAPDCVNDVIDKNLDYCKLINPENIDINILNPKIKPEKEEIVKLSFTAIENFNECPFKYKLSEKFSFNFSNKKAIDDGIFIHSALEIINKKIKTKKGYIGDEEVRKTVKQLFETNYLKPEKEQLDDIAEKIDKYEKFGKYEETLEEYKEKLERYNEKIDRIKQKIGKLDEKLEFMTNDVIRYYNKIGNNRTIKYSEYPFYIKGEGYAFSGVVDLIYEKDGKLGILDYKNTDLVEGKYKEKYEKQLHYYVMALRDEKGEFEGQKIEEIEIYAIRKDELISFEIREDLIEKLRDELETIAGKIKNNEFEQNCEDCSDCQFRKICKK